MVLGPQPEAVAETVDTDLSDIFKQQEGGQASLPNPFAEAAAETELQRRFLVEHFAKKLGLPLSSIAIGSAVGGTDARLRINCDPSQRNKIDDIIDDLQYPLRLLEFKDITLVGPDHKVMEVNTVTADTLGYALDRDLVMCELTRGISPYIANGIAGSSIEHLDRCLVKNPLDSALVAYRIVFKNQSGLDVKRDLAKFTWIEKATEEMNPDQSAIAKRFSQLATCTADGGKPGTSADEMAQFIREHLNPDVVQTYLIKDVYDWAGEPEKGKAALQEQPRQRARVERSIWLDGITFVLTVILFATIVLFKKQLFKLPDLEESVACPVPYGWIKPFLIAAFTSIMMVMGFCCAWALAPEQIQESSMMLSAYFDPIKTAAMTCFEEMNLTVPAIFASIVLVGRGMKTTDFLKLHFKTDRYEKRDIVMIGLQCFIVTFTAAMLATALTYWFHFPWEKPGTAAIDLLTASGSPPAIALLFLGYAILAPILEEMAFRGILHPFLRRKFAAAPSIIIGAALFAVAHLEFTPWWLLDKFVFGAVNAYALEKTNSIIPGIISHILTNTFVLVFMLVSLN
jgi:membrane protease YdiL (CAAX protease family)